MAKLLVLIIAFFALPVLACDVKGPAMMSLAVSTADQKMFSYATKTVEEKIPEVSVTNCRETVSKRRFLMVSYGPEVVSGSDTIRGANFDRQFPETSTCRLRNTDLASGYSIASQKKEFDNKWNAIKTCVLVTVTELGKRPLQVPPHQPGCTLTRINDKKLAFNGGFCFFTPAQDSNLLVSLDLRPECKSLDGLKRLGLPLQDFETSLNFYTSAASKDEINDLASLGSTSVRLSTNPVKELFPVSDDFGILRPTFPANYPLTDLHFGKIEFVNVSDTHVIVKSPFVASNRCGLREKNGLSSSPCSYAHPVIAELNLLNARGEKLFTWYDGGIAPSQWLGIINGEGYQVAKDALKTGETYALEAVFSDPYYDYRSFKRLVQNRIQSFYRGLPSYSNPEGISEIPSIKEIEQINQMLEVSQIRDLSFQAGINDLSPVRRRLAAYFSTTHYPPMYERVCSDVRGKCIPVGKPFVKLRAEFKLTPEYGLVDLSHERSSILLPEYKKRVITVPEYTCE